MSAQSDFPIDPENGRPICTMAKPRPKDDSGRWAHESVECTHFGDYSDSYRCKACGAEWTEELPE